MEIFTKEVFGQDPGLKYAETVPFKSSIEDCESVKMTYHKQNTLGVCDAQAPGTRSPLCARAPRPPTQ